MGPPICWSNHFTVHRCLPLILSFDSLLVYIPWDTVTISPLICHLFHWLSLSPLFSSGFTSGSFPIFFLVPLHLSDHYNLRVLRAWFFFLYLCWIPRKSTRSHDFKCHLYAVWALRRKISNVNPEEEFILSEMDMDSIWLAGPKFKFWVQRWCADWDLLHIHYAENPQTELSISYSASVSQYREVLCSVTAMLCPNKQTVTRPDQSKCTKHALICTYINQSKLQFEKPHLHETDWEVFYRKWPFLFLAEHRHPEFLQEAASPQFANCHLLFPFSL